MAAAQSPEAKAIWAAMLEGDNDQPYNRVVTGIDSLAEGYVGDLQTSGVQNATSNLVRDLMLLCSEYHELSGSTPDAELNEAARQRLLKAMDGAFLAIHERVIAEKIHAIAVAAAAMIKSAES